MSEILSGKYVSTSQVEHNGRKGILLKIESPDKKVNTIPFEVLMEVDRAVGDIALEEGLSFIIFYGSTGKIHAGADIRLFAGEIDLKQVHDYLMAGARLDLKIKALSRKKRTVSIMNGKRFGGSVEWPLMAQYCVCTPETTIQFSECHLGIIPGWDGVLNVLLRSTRINTLYLTATGELIGAQHMLEAGLIHGIFPENSIFEQALEIATVKSVSPPAEIRDLVDRQTLDKIIITRTDTNRYRNLFEDVSQKLEKNINSDYQMEQDEVKQYIRDELKVLGKPIAPAAAKAVCDLVGKYEAINWQDEKGIRNMAFEEVESCNELMKTQDRRAGIKSILSDNPLETIPIFLGK
jgi:enoyl-CoA hydratase/carnithine racemase